MIGKPSMDYYASAAKQLGVPIDKVGLDIPPNTALLKIDLFCTIFAA